MGPACTYNIPCPFYLAYEVCSHNYYRGVKSGFIKLIMQVCEIPAGTAGSMVIVILYLITVLF